MTFPSNPNEDDLHEAFGRKLRYRSGKWQVVSSPTVATVTEEAPKTEAVTQAVDLPMTGNEIGAMAYVQESNRLYVWNGSGWFEVALVNTNPTITAGGNATYELAPDGTPTVVTLTANDPEGLPLTWSYAVTSGSLEDTTVTNVGGQFTITPGLAFTAFDLTFSASDGINVSTSTSSFAKPPPRKLWRLLSVVTPPQYELWDHDAIISANTGWWNGSTSVTTGITSSGVALTPGTWDVFAANTNPLSDAPLSGADVQVRSSGTLDPNIGGRTSCYLPAGRYVAVYFPDEVTDITRIYHRTFTAGRAGRIPPNMSLQYYNGDLSATYDSNNWVTYATLFDDSTSPYVVWNNISENSTINSVYALA